MYSGDANNSASTSSRLNQVVDRAPSTTAIGSSLNPSIVGQPITFTATVTGVNPSGSVTFFDGAAPLSGPVSLVGGQASLSTANLAVGTHPITAVYDGDGNNTGSSSAPLAQVVGGRVATTTALASSVNPSTAGQPVTFTATVTGAAPTGSVDFYDGNTLMGTVQLTGAVASFTTSTLRTGNRQISAVYRGDVSNLPSTSPRLRQRVR